MKTLVLDVETTIKSNGDPFHKDNKLCYIGLLDDVGKVELYDIDYSSDPYIDRLDSVVRRIGEVDLLIGFNIKFDLHWIRRYAPNIRFRSVWDCQYAEYLLANQTIKYPSLAKACADRGLGNKLDYIATSYWDKGIDTTSIPREELELYLTQDLRLTKALYLAQYPSLYNNNLFKLHNKDLLVIEEMEFNGMKFDTIKSEKESIDCEQHIAVLDAEIKHYLNATRINLNSTDHLSSCLYGGSCRVPEQQTVFRYLKDGRRKEYTRKGFEVITFPRLIDPLEGSETKPTNGWSDYRLAIENKERDLKGLPPIYRTYSVDKRNLRSLKAKAKGKAQEIIDLLLRRSEMEKLLTTYFRGIPEIISEHGWADGFVHGKFNQCVTKTGRLSSSDPNLQNNAEQIKHLFVSRYE